MKAIQLKKSFVLGMVLVSLCLFIVVVIWQHMHGESGHRWQIKTVSVSFNELGYVPSKVTIPGGSSVIFTNSSSLSFWPASDLHPTHGLYPEFDPKQPIGPGESWSFTFNQPGVWKYHDHLRPEFVGEIVVTGADGEVITTTDCNLNGQDPGCYRQELEKLTKNEGAYAALDKIAEWYSSDSNFATDCHGYTHIVGQKAFQRFAEHKSLEMGENFRACGYGFFHGFVEAFVQQNGTMEGVREFCLDVSEVEDIQVINKAYIACFHGIGHGLVDGSDPRDFGDAQKFISKGLDICEEIGENYREKYLCASGAFNSLAISYNDPKYKLAYDPKDVYAICAMQGTDFAKEGCYEEMNTLVMSVYKGDFGAAIQSASKVRDAEYRVVAVRNLPPVAVGNGENVSIVDLANECRLLDDDLSVPCLQGLVGGLLEHGKPGEEYIKASEVCLLKQLNNQEQKSCFDYYFSSVGFLYSREVWVRACEILPKSAQSFCPQN